MRSRPSLDPAPDPAPEAALRFSIVIANYNYRRFVGRAIDSALEQDWPAIEVIVVDDGSTDGSRAEIERYGDRITAIFQPNGGQRSANNRGFAHATGEVIVFLDADDVLLPGFARAVADAWRPGVSKVQVLMARVDAAEQPMGSIVPAIATAPSAGQIAEWARRTGEYPTPPGSGNAYARAFLARFFPIGPEHDGFTDSTCLALAPFLGDVITVPRALVLYRQHGANDSNLFADQRRFGREVARALRRQRSAEELCAQIGGRRPDPECVYLGRHLLQLRVASLRSDRAHHPIPTDTTSAVLRDLARSLIAGGFEPWWKRLTALAWSAATLLAPARVAPALIRWRFAR